MYGFCARIQDTPRYTGNHGMFGCKDMYVSDGPSFGLLFDVEDPLGRRVQLSNNQWFGHVLQRHPELVDLIAEVELAVAHPDVMCADAVDAFRTCHYRKMINEPRRPKYLKVVVNLSESRDTGLVVTAYITSRLKPGEEVIHGHRVP